MDEIKVEQVEAQAEVETKAEEVVEAPAEEVVEAPVEEVEAPAEEVVEAPVEAEVQAEEVVAEGCEAGETCKPKKETEDDEEEKKVAVKEEAEEVEAEQAEEIKVEVAPEEVQEALETVASELVAEEAIEAIEEDPSKEAEIVEDSQKLLSKVFGVLEQMVNGCTVELNGHQVEVKDFVNIGGKVNMSLPAGINPPCKSEDDESEKKVTIQAYHEGAEEIDYQAKFAESEALMDDVVGMVESTSAKYTALVEKYNEVVKELQAYKVSEAYSITVEDAADMLADYSFTEVCEALDRAEAEEEMIVEAEEEKAEDKAEEKEEAKEEKEDKKEEKKEEEQEKALEEIKESVEGAVISESVDVVAKPRVYSAFASASIVESKKAKKAYSVFAD